MGAITEAIVVSDGSDSEHRDPNVSNEELAVENSREFVKVQKKRATRLGNMAMSRG
jgi:hypothetical protein